MKVQLHLSVSWEGLGNKPKRVPRCQSGLTSRLGSLSAAPPHAPQVIGLLMHHPGLMPPPLPPGSVPDVSGPAGHQPGRDSSRRSRCFLVLAGLFEILCRTPRPGRLNKIAGLEFCWRPGLLCPQMVRLLQWGVFERKTRSPRSQEQVNPGGSYFSLSRSVFIPSHKRSELCVLRKKLKREIKRKQSRL